MRGKNIILIIKKGRRGEEKEIEMEKRYQKGKVKRLMGGGVGGQGGGGGTCTWLGMGLF